MLLQSSYYNANVPAFIDDIGKCMIAIFRRTSNKNEVLIPLLQYGVIRDKPHDVKVALTHARKAMAQIGLRMRAVRSGPSLFANTSHNDQAFYRWTTDARDSQAGLGPWLFAYTQGYFSVTRFRQEIRKRCNDHIKANKWITMYDLRVFYFASLKMIFYVFNVF